MADREPQREAILAALEHLLAWPDIARSPQLARFLDYIVRRTLDGDEQAIKAYSIAVDVLGRPADFDPQADPIVRVQARRLRGLIEQYYRGEGAGDLVRIVLPVGRYVPEFVIADAAVGAVEPAAQTTASAPGGGLPPTWFALAAAAAGLAVVAFSLATWQPRTSGAAPGSLAAEPSVKIVEFQNLAGDAPGAPLVAGLALELVTDLEQFEDIDVRYGAGGEDPTPNDASFVLTGIVRPDGPVVQYSVILTQAASNMVVWNRTISVAATEATEAAVLDRVSQALSLVLGSPRGPLHVAARQFLASGEEPAGRESVYLCRMLFNLYREAASAAEAGRAAQCLEALPEGERESAQALAARASLVAENPGPPMSAPAGDPERYRIAEAHMRRAIEQAPVSGFVWEQRARLLELRGDLAGARTAFGSSIQLNPANGDALAAYARLLALGGDLDGAEPMARAAVEGTPEPPPWYHGVPALLALRDRRPLEAMEHAERYAEADRELGPILAILAGQAARDNTVVNRYLPQVLEEVSFRTSGVLPRLRQRIADDALLQDIRSGLIAAGAPEEALVTGF